MQTSAIIGPELDDDSMPIWLGQRVQPVCSHGVSMAMHPWRQVAPQQSCTWVSLRLSRVYTANCAYIRSPSKRRSRLNKHYPLAGFVHWLLWRFAKETLFIRVTVNTVGHIGHWTCGAMMVDLSSEIILTTEQDCPIDVSSYNTTHVFEKKSMDNNCAFPTTDMCLLPHRQNHQATSRTNVKVLSRITNHKRSDFLKSSSTCIAICPPSLVSMSCPNRKCPCIRENQISPYQR